MHDLFAVVESEGVDLFDPGAPYENFSEMRSDAVSLLSRNHSTTFYKQDAGERAASIRVSKEAMQKILEDK